MGIGDVRRNQDKQGTGVSYDRKFWTKATMLPSYADTVGSLHIRSKWE